LRESILPALLLGMPAELEAVDRLLDDPRFFEPYRAFFHPVLGRPSVPIETYPRLMFLKYRCLSASNHCVERWPTRSHGSGSVGSRWVAGCRTRPR
jgi:hypothetical protein